MNTDEEEQLPLATDYEVRLRALERLWDEGFHDEGPKTVNGSFSESSNSNKANGAGDDDEVELEESTFSFITAMEPFSVPFLTGLAVVALKNLMVLFMIVDIFKGGGTKMTDKIPALVSIPVFMAQLISYALAGLTSNDLCSAFMMVYNGWNPSMKENFPGGKLWQFFASSALAFIDGALVLFASFFLVVTSSTAFDVFLNFAAVAFIAELDEGFFKLAEQDLLGEKNFKAVSSIKGKKYTRPVPKMRPRLVRRSLFWLIILITTVSGAVVYALQRKGEFAPKYLFIQWDDEIRSDLALHSGFYKLEGLKRVNEGESFEYAEEHAVNQGRNDYGKIRYCHDRNKWTLVRGDRDPCDPLEILAESPKTRLLDIMAIAKEMWDAKTTISETVTRFLPMVDFYFNKGCEQNEDCGGGRCDKSDSRCDCAGTNFTGSHCQYKKSDTCEKMVLDYTTGRDFPLTKDGEVSSEYMMYPNVEVYHHPIYWNNMSRDVVFFTGLRWIISNIDSILEENNNMAVEELQFLHARDIQTFDYISEKVPFLSPEDKENSPKSIAWLRPEPIGVTVALSNASDLADLSSPYRFLCATCQNDSQCLNGGTCSSDKTCLCIDGAEGSLCELPPGNNGQCNNFFNKPEYDYDGGDCCLGTCTSTVGHMCGVSKIGKNPFSVGFDSCEDTKIDRHCAPNGSGCLTLDESFRLVDVVDPLSFLSSNGNLVVMMDTEKGYPFVWERNYANAWSQRGSPLPITFGRDDEVGSISVATPPSHFVGKQQLDRLPLSVAISVSYSSSSVEEGIYVFESRGDDAAGLSWDAIKLDLTEGRKAKKIGSAGVVLSMPDPAAKNPDQEDTYILHSYHAYTNCSTPVPSTLAVATISGNGRLLAGADDSNKLSIYRFSCDQGLQEISSTRNDTKVEGRIVAMELDWSGERLTVVEVNTVGGVAKIHRFLVGRGSLELELVREPDDIPLPRDSTGINEGIRVHVSHEASTVALAAPIGEKECYPTNQFFCGTEMNASIYSLAYDESFPFLTTVSYTEMTSVDPVPSLILSDDASTILTAKGEIGNYKHSYDILNLNQRCDRDSVQVRVTSLLETTTVASDIWNVYTEKFFPLANVSVVDKILLNAYTFFENNNDYYSLSCEDRVIQHGIASKEVCFPRDLLTCSYFTSHTTGWVGTRPADTVLSIQENTTSITETLLSSVNSEDGALRMRLLDDAGCEEKDREELEELSCRDDESLFVLLLPAYRDQNPGTCLEVVGHPSWELTISGTEEFIEYKDYYNHGFGQYLVEQRCLSSSGCYQLQFIDPWYGYSLSGNGKLWWDGDLKVDGDLLDSTFQIGDCDNIF